MEFLEIHKKHLESQGFWEEGYKSTLLKSAEQNYKTEIIRDYTIVDIVINDKKVLMKWVKRFQPLTKTELKEQYGR